jgi:hypothetical protein
MRRRPLKCTLVILALSALAGCGADAMRDYQHLQQDRLLRGADHASPFFPP